ncbi:724_t:CDS:2, partial [Funneliformis caledonium]
ILSLRQKEVLMSEDLLYNVSDQDKNKLVIVVSEALWSGRQ